jgi:VIT1/CCC1 family predicted Fe2+/Mn2+ transporter
MSKPKKDRSIATTIIASLIGAVILVLLLPLFPLSDVIEILFFSFGILIVVLCAIVAIGGKRGTIREIIYSLSFWS